MSEPLLELWGSCPMPTRWPSRREQKPNHPVKHTSKEPFFPREKPPHHHWEAIESMILIRGGSLIAMLPQSVTPPIPSEVQTSNRSPSGLYSVVHIAGCRANPVDADQLADIIYFEVAPVVESIFNPSNYYRDLLGCVHLVLQKVERGDDVRARASDLSIQGRQPSPLVDMDRCCFW